MFVFEKKARPGNGLVHGEGDDIAPVGDRKIEAAGKMVGENRSDLPVAEEIITPQIATDNPRTFETGRAAKKKRLRVDTGGHALIVKGINQDEVVAFFPRFPKKLQAVQAVHHNPRICRQAEVASRHMDDMGRGVDGIDSAMREMVEKETDQRAGPDADDEDILRFRHQQQGGEHIPGVRQNQILGSGQGHPALQMFGAEIETPVVAVISDLDPVSIPRFFVDKKARTVCHTMPCSGAAGREAAGSGMRKMLPASP